MKRAVVDIGTNSLLLTIADIEGREIKSITELSRITRLGKGVESDGMIKEENIEVTLNALKEFADKIHNKGVEKVKYIATEILRKASNRDYVLKRLSSVCLGDIEVISEAQEGFYSFYSVAYMNPSKEICVIDVGGGSTEITTGVDSSVSFSKSLKLGAVGLYEKFFDGKDIYPYNDVLKAQGYVNRILEENIPINLVGNFMGLYVSGGTITNVAAILEGMRNYNADLIDNRVIKLSEIEGLFEIISNMSKESRARIAGIEENRADILPSGILILRSILHYLNKDVIRVSSRGVRWGVMFKLEEEGN